MSSSDHAFQPNGLLRPEAPLDAPVWPTSKASAAGEPYPSAAVSIALL